MTGWGVRHTTTVVMLSQAEQQQREYEDKKPLHEDAASWLVKTEPLQLPEFSKRKRRDQTQLKEMKAASLHGKRSWSSCKRRSKIQVRWSDERYKLAEQSMLEILKAEGATFEKPITRPALRMAARKCIGDTGLLDHLLKHIDGKVAPGGAERFRRWFSRNGIMEYWLENADLANIRQQAGVLDPYWIPPSGIGLRPYEDSVSAEEMKLLKAELNKMKSDMQELLSKKKEQSQGNQFGEMFKEIVKWKVETDQNLKVILSSWKSMQDMYEELIAWKAELEQQLADIRSLLSSTQESKQHPASSTRVSEGWEDWLESTKLDDVVQGNELLPWFDSTDSLVNVEQEVVMQDPFSSLPLSFQPGVSPSQGSGFARELERINKDMMNSNEDDQEFVLKKPREDYHVNVTPDSSTTVNSWSDKSPFKCQEMFLELFNWKAKMEQKLNELSKSTNIIRQS